MSDGAQEPTETLAARLRRERALPPAVAAGTIRTVAAALAGKVHGALGPERVLLRGSRVELAGGGESEPPYRAPEQWRGGPVDARTDVYALGCILYQALVGVPPFPGPGDADYAEQHELARPPRPGKAHADLAPFDAVVRRALAKDPPERWLDADAFARALPAAAAPPPSSRAARWRHAAMAVAVIAAGVGALLWRKQSPPPVLPDAAVPRPPLEPVVTIGACRSPAAPVPAPGRVLAALGGTPAGGGGPGDLDFGAAELPSGLKPFPVESLAREYRRKTAPGYLRQHRPELARCYRATLARTPPPAAVVTLALTLAADGTVELAAVTGLGDAAVESCLAEVVRRTRFSPPHEAAFELRCPVALAYAGELPPGAPGVTEIDEDAPAAGALHDLAAARDTAPARRTGRGWTALGVLLRGEAVPPASPHRPALLRAVSILVDADETRLGTVSGAPGPVERFSPGDLASLRARLTALRADDEFADVLWVEIAAGAGVRCGGLVPVLEAARDAGFPVIEPRARDELSARL